MKYKGLALEITSNTQTQSSSLLSNNEKNKTEESKNSTSFEETLTKNNEEKKDEAKTLEVKRTSEELVADIISLLKTGMTEGEIEVLQKLLRELKDKIKEGEYSEKEIESMLKKIELEIQALKKRISGEVIVKPKENNTSIKEENVNDSLSAKDIGFLNRIEEAITSLEEVKSGKTKKDGISIAPNESELLVLIKEFQK